MLKITTFDDRPRLVFDMTSNEESTQQADIFRDTLNSAVADSINPITDNEVVEFKPESPEISLFMFFSAFKNQEWLDQVKTNLEENFSFHIEDSKSVLISDGQRTITNPKTVLQSNGLPAPRPHFFFHRKRLDILKELPYVILNPVEQLTVTLPSKEGFPIFYNSFALPFANNLAKWDADALGFSNKTYLYNSFLLLDFYTTNNALTQKKVMSIPVYVNGRYMVHEENQKGVRQIRPAMFLNNDTEGFSVVWLKKHNLDKLYVRLSFWDALNGQQISLIPSTDLSVNKKWVQDPNTFKLENLYLEYRFDYTNRTYKIFEYNQTSGQYDIKTTSLDLYQLVYDEYFAKRPRINNVRPVKIETFDNGEVEGEDIALSLSLGNLSKTVNSVFNDTLPAYNNIEKKYNQKHKTFFGKALYDLFGTKKAVLKDRALSYFETRFANSSNYIEDLGNVVITNTTDLELRIRRVEVVNVKIENKNNFYTGTPITVNKYTRTNVNVSPSAYLCDTIVTFKGSTFYSKLNPIKTPYDAAGAALYNKQAEMYSGYYYDEANNKVVEKTQEDMDQILNQLEASVKRKLFQDVMTKGGGIFGFIKNKKKYETKVKGLTLNEKDLNLLLRSDVLEKSGATARYELLFPATTEKLATKTEDYRDFSITIKSSVTPQYEEFEPGLALTFNTDVIMGKEFFKVFISTNDNLAISYDVAIQFVDKNGTVYKKIIPCSLKYV